MRRAHLPEDRGSPSSGCERRVGRFCYWYDDEPPLPAGHEDRAIGEARARLLQLLDSASRRSPDNAWLTGQRVRYRLDAGDSVAALQVAHDCGAGQWRCAALTGLVLHVTRRYAPADSAFRVALDAMPEEQRCAWNDIALLLEGEPGRRYARQSCEARTAMEDRFWWLARPLLASPANDARTEWLARRTMATLLAEAASPHDLAWGRDSEELLLRFGWSTWYTRAPVTSASFTPQWSLIGHSRTPAFHVAPAMRLLADTTLVAGDNDWNLTQRQSGFRYAPLHADTIVPLPHQVAIFRRGDSALVMAAYDASRLPFLRDASLTAALVVQAGPRDPGARAIRDAAPRQGVLMVHAPWHPGLIGVEAWSASARVAARWRSGLAPPARNGRVAISDLLLVDAASPQEGTLDEVAPRALPDATVRGGRVGVFWETYGLRNEGEVVAVTLTAVRTDTPWTRRMAQALGLTDRATPLRVSWRERPDARTGATSRLVVANLSMLAPGRYRLTLVVQPGDGAAASREREIVVER